MTIKERPILFGAPMVRAILDGSKTQTRRIIKPQPTLSENTGFNWKGAAYGIGFERGETARNFSKHCCPYGKPDDRLWVRETHYLVRAQGKPDGHVIEIDYKADPDHPIRMCPQKWRPSIHMPRSASRILLDIISVRVERLNDISEGDAKAEGIFELDYCGQKTYQNYLLSNEEAECSPMLASPVASFTSLWESINGADSWQANPWVWVIEFRRIA